MNTKVNDKDLQILSLFTKEYNKKHHIRETAELIKVSSRTALKTLAKLELKGILKAQINGKNKTYEINKSSLTKEYFILTEQYKKINFLEKQPLIKEIIEKIEKHINGIGLIFGSYAKEIEKENSDLDLMIIGKSKEKEIKEIGNLYGIEINIKEYPKKLFQRKKQEDILLKEVNKNHIIIKNNEEYVNEVLEWTK